MSLVPTSAHVICIGLLITLCADDLRLQIVTIATEETDGYHRFMRSARLFDLNVEVMFIINTTLLYPLD